jgi:hypothetical protein
VYSHRFFICGKQSFSIKWCGGLFYVDFVCTLFSKSCVVFMCWCVSYSLFWYCVVLMCDLCVDSSLCCICVLMVLVYLFRLVSLKLTVLKCQSVPTPVPVGFE